MVDWTGNKASAFKTIGADGHGLNEREANDYYATDPIVIEPLMLREPFEGSVWECACGAGHLSQELEVYDFTEVVSTDLIYRGYGQGGVDFLKTNTLLADNIITNPPYKYATEFVYHALELKPQKIAMFCKLTFLETKGRKPLFKKYPPKIVYVFSERVKCALNGQFHLNQNSNAIAYAWYIWDRDYTGITQLDWI